MSLDHWAKRVDGVLDRLLALKDGAAPDELMRAMRYAALSPGKRLRPALAYEAAAVFGATPERVDPFAAALEMIHASSLIHDDLPCMDNDDLRRGRPTCHIRFGEATALLAGDGLLAHAFFIMSGETERGVPGATCAMGIIARAAGPCGIAGGQTLDKLCEGAELAGEKAEAMLLRIERAKTTALIEASVLCGAALGGTNAEDTCRMEVYGRELGYAFQIADDILNATATSEQLGKAAGSDSRRGKLTAVSVWGIEGARDRLERHTLSACHALAEFGCAGDVLCGIARSLCTRGM